MVETVKSAAGLREALKTAKAGTTIELQGGNYGELQLSAPYGDPWSRFAGEVTVRSADPNNPATFGRIYLNAVENLTFDGIAIDYTSPEGLTGRQFFEDNAILVRDSKNITIRNSELEGDVLDRPGSPLDGTPVARSMFIRDSEGVVVEGNEIHSWYRGALFHDDKDVVLRGNDVHDIRSDGFNFAAVQNVLIEDNHLHDFAIATDDGVHRDMIQIWTANTDTPTTDVTIRGNHLNSGSGVWTQSIFMRNEAVDTGAAGREMFYKNVVVENNVIYNGHLHGITIGQVDGLTITNNTLLHNPASGDDGGVSRPQIRVAEDARNVQVELNIAQAVTTPPGNAADWKVADNLLVQNRDPEKPNYYGDLFVDALAGGGGLDALRALPGSIIHQGGYGSTLTRTEGDTPGGPVVSPENPPEAPAPEPAPAPGNESPPAQEPEPEPTPDPGSGDLSFDLALSYDDGRVVDGDLTNGEVLALDDLDDGRVTLVATPSGDVGRVEMDLIGIHQGVEMVAPYVLFGDIEGTYDPGTMLGAGDYQMVLTAYSEARGGTVLGTETVSFSVANQPAAMPEPAPEPGPPAQDATVIDFDNGEAGPSARLVGNAAISPDGTLALDGDGGYLALDGGGQPAFTGARSVAFDVRFDGAADAFRPVWEHLGYGLQLRGGEINAAVGTGGGDMAWTESIDAAGLFDGGWHRLALSIDGEADVLRFYIDGDLAIERMDLDIELPDSSRPLTFGSAGWGGSLDGEIDNIVVADAALDADLLA